MSRIMRNLDDAFMDRLKARAHEYNRSRKAEIRPIPNQSAKVDRASANQIALRIRAQLKGKTFPECAELVREDRER
jgi:plasmid stability protein